MQSRTLSSRQLEPRRVTLFAAIVIMIETASALLLTLVAQATGVSGLGWGTIFVWTMMFSMIAVFLWRGPLIGLALLFIPTALCSCFCYFLIGRWLFGWVAFQG